MSSSWALIFGKWRWEYTVIEVRQARHERLAIEYVEADAVVGASRALHLDLCFGTDRVRSYYNQLEKVDVIRT